MTYPSNGESVAHTQIKALVERVERLDEELKAINEDKKEIFSEARGNGFDVAALKQVIKIRRQDANERLEREAIVELYMSALGMVPAPETDEAPVHVHMRVENIEEFGAVLGEDGIDGPEITNLPKTVGAIRAITEPQPLNPAGSDLATPPANDDGQVADIQPETADQVPSVEGVNEPQMTVADDANTGGKDDLTADQAHTLETNGTLPVTPGSDVENAVSGKTVAASAAAAPIVPVKYAPKGVITWEASPPQGVIRHDYSAAFGKAGQDIAVIEDDMSNARSAPIVKIGNVILDGWARFMKARSLGIEYPVVQYDGSDSLTDCIKWNTAGRMLTEEQSFRIAQRLAKAEPKRKADIYAAFELGMVLA